MLVSAILERCNLASDEMRKHRRMANAVGRFRFCANGEIGMKAEGDAGHGPIGVHSRRDADARGKGGATRCGPRKRRAPARRS